MTLTTTGAASDGLVYVTLTGTDAAGRAIVEQGSGVLLSDDEVLTAAHLVYNGDGTLRSSGTASVGYGGGSAIATARIDGVQVGARRDYTTLDGVGGDFAVLHLSTKVSNGTVFSLGSDMTAGTFDVGGYPVGTAGALDTRTEALSLVPGADVYAGGSLNDGADDPNGSSGGSVYRIVDGRPTAYGVISADSASDTAKGYFKALSDADVAQIRSWVAAADGAGAAGVLSAAPAAADPLDLGSSTPGFSADVAATLSADAGGASGGRRALMTDVAAAIADAVRQGGTFEQMVEVARGDLASGSSMPRRAVAYLAGFLSGATEAWASDVVRSADAVIAGSVAGAAQRAAAAAGRAEALGMGLSNTSALVSPAMAALAGAIADGGGRADAVQAHRTPDMRADVTLAAAAHENR